MAEKKATLQAAGQKVYECQECSGKFSQENGVGRNGTMCPDCLNKFGTKVSDNAAQCPACDEWIDLDSWEEL